MKYEVPEIKIIVDGYEFVMETETLFVGRSDRNLRFTFLEIEKPETLFYLIQRAEVENYPCKKAVEKFKKLISFV